MMMAFSRCSFTAPAAAVQTSCIFVVFSTASGPVSPKQSNASSPLSIRTRVRAPAPEARP